eukprot:1049788-Prorocentrum_minimum.AAC.2
MASGLDGWLYGVRVEPLSERGGRGWHRAEEAEEEAAREAARQREQQRAAMLGEMAQSEENAVAEMEADRALVNDFEMSMMGEQAQHEHRHRHPAK